MFSTFQMILVDFLTECSYIAQVAEERLKINNTFKKVIIYFRELTALTADASNFGTDGSFSKSWTSSTPLWICPDILKH